MDHPCNGCWHTMLKAEFCTWWIQKVRRQVFVITSSNTDRFSKFFQSVLSRKFVIKLSLNIPPHLKRVATLPREILMSENWLTDATLHRTRRKKLGNDCYADRWKCFTPPLRRLQRRRPVEEHRPPAYPRMSAIRPRSTWWLCSAWFFPADGRTVVQCTDAVSPCNCACLSVARTCWTSRP